MKDFWCERPEHLKSISVELWRNLTQPKDHCSMLNAPYNTLSPSNITDYFSSQPNLELIQCKSFEFDVSFIGQTIISEWSLVCDQLYMGSVVEMCFLAGAAIGSVVSGYISDQYGRRHTLLTFALIQAICGNYIFDYFFIFA